MSLASVQPSDPANACTIVWFRYDLRLADNPALNAAAERGARVLPVFIWAPDEQAPWQPGAASRWWLHRSLKSLSQDLGRLGTPLIIRQGASCETLVSLVKDTRADAVFWNRGYEPVTLPRDMAVLRTLADLGIDVKTFPGDVLREPDTLLNSSGKPFQVFAAFWRACQKQIVAESPLPPPARLPSPRVAPLSECINELELEPKIDWAAGLQETWQPGERGALREWKRFLRERARGYPQARDLPGTSGTSRLSPHLRFGEISPRRLLHDFAHTAADQGLGEWKSHRFSAEMGWREFARHLLFHFPRMPEEPLKQSFADFPWHLEPALLKAWQRGRTGLPLVDAGMRQLWATGWMHNRVRMVAASFLVKNLRQPWQAGLRWFWDTLVDADLANNSMGWQWVAGCGADAAPFFRVFNPVAQGERFDPQGVFVRQWVPELFRLPDKWIHKPHLAPTDVLAQAGVRLGIDYPEPIVSLFASRQAALEAYDLMRSRNKNPRSDRLRR